MWQIVVVLLLLAGAAIAKDRGQYAEVSPEIREFFKGLRNAHGSPCCDLSDGRTLEDPEWEYDGENFRVKVDGDWQKVPSSSLLSVRNPYGPAVVWLVPDFEHEGKRKILCFLPGAMS